MRGDTRTAPAMTGIAMTGIAMTGIAMTGIAMTHRAVIATVETVNATTGRTAGIAMTVDPRAVRRRRRRPSRAPISTASFVSSLLRAPRT